MPNNNFWPNWARLALTVSMQFEAGAQPISGAPGAVSEPIAPGYPDRPQNAFYEYGIRQGIPRLLRLFEKHNLKVTSFLIGQAVDNHPGRHRLTRLLRFRQTVSGGPFIAASRFSVSEPDKRRTATRGRPSR